MSERRIRAAVFLGAFALAAFVTKPYILSWNDASRFATIEALTSEHTFAIEHAPLAAATQDKIVHRGHTYSDKPPALALQGALVAAAIAPLGDGLGGSKEGPPIYLITLFTVGLWFAVGCAYAYAFARLLDAGVRLGVLVAALTGAGTLSLPYATLLVNHVPAGAAALAGAYHLLRGRDSAAHAFAGGFFLSLAYAFDSAAVVFALFAVVMLWRAPVRSILAALVAVVPVVAAQGAFNVAVSGALGPPAMNQASWSDPSSPFYRAAAQSMFFFHTPLDYAAYAGYVLAGGKGLLSYTPLVVVCAYGFVRMAAAVGGAPRRLALACGATFLVYFALIVAYTNDYGALNYGERRYVDFMFVFGIGLTPALLAVRGTLAVQTVRALLVLSLATSALGVMEPFGGAPGESGFAVAAREYAHLVHRAPIAAALDALLLAVLVVAVLRAWPRAQRLSGSTVLVEGNGFQTR